MIADESLNKQCARLSLRVIPITLDEKNSPFGHFFFIVFSLNRG